MTFPLYRDLYGVWVQSREKEISKVYLEKSIKLLKLFPEDILDANEDDIKMVAKNVSELQKLTIAISML